MMGDEAIYPYPEETVNKYQGFVRLFKLLARYHRLKKNHPDLIGKFHIEAYVSNAGAYMLKVEGGPFQYLSTDPDDKSYDSVRKMIANMEERIEAKNKHRRLVESARSRMPQNLKEFLKPERNVDPFVEWVDKNLTADERAAMYMEYPHLPRNNEWSQL